MLLVLRLLPWDKNGGGIPVEMMMMMIMMMMMMMVMMMAETTAFVETTVFGEKYLSLR